MFSHRHTAAAAVAAACLTAVLGSAVASADDATDAADQRFIEAVGKLDIPTAPDQDVPAIGHRVCDMLTANLKGAVNPVPIVRGVRDTLVQNGISRAQAGGLMHASVAIYCPEHSAFIGR